MSFQYPWLLMTLVPIIFLIARFPARSRMLTGIRIILAVLVLLALSGPSIHKKLPGGDLVVLLDTSASLPQGEKDTFRRWLARLEEERGSEDRMTVLGFDEHVRLLNGFDTPFVDLPAWNRGFASNLDQGLDRALGVLADQSSDSGRPGRILVISDGLIDASRAAGPAARAGLSSVPIDYHLPEDTRRRQDLAVVRMDAPFQAAPFSGYTLSYWVHAPRAMTVRFQLARGDQLIAAGSRSVEQGLNRFSFADPGSGPGIVGFRFEVAPEDGSEDPIPENNRAFALVSVKGERPFLLLSNHENTSLASLLRGSGLDVVVVAPEGVPWSPVFLNRWSGLIMEDIRADQIGYDGMQLLAEWIKAGGGLYMTGGPNSFGRGGWFDSALDPLLPVSMELRKEHRKFALALVAVLDRSGSMGAETDSGDIKMDLANRAVVGVAEMMVPGDRLGVLAVDMVPHEVLPLTDVGERGSVYGKVLSIEAGGGGIYIFNALVTGIEMLNKSDLGSRHMILFADAADAEEPGKYEPLLGAARAGGITVSVVGLGSEKDVDAGLLKDIAKRGEGEVYFTQAAEDLPRIFAQDTYTRLRAGWVEEPTGTQQTAHFAALSDQVLKPTPALPAYNLNYLKPEARAAIVTTDENQAPISAFWRVGLGRVAVFCADASGRFAGDWAAFEDVGVFHSALTRWAGGLDDDADQGAVLLPERKDDGLWLNLFLDPGRVRDPFSGNPVLRVLSQGRDGRGRGEPKTMQKVGPDQWRTALDLEDGKTAVASLGLGETVLQTGALTAMFPAEFRHAGTEEGDHNLARIAALSGGRSRSLASGIWDTFPARSRLFALRSPLILLAALVFLIEILERRTAMISALKVPRIRWGRAQTTITDPTPTSGHQIMNPPVTSELETEDDLFAALNQAEKKTKRG